MVSEKTLELRKIQPNPPEMIKLGRPKFKFRKERHGSDKHKNHLNKKATWHKVYGAFGGVR